MQEEADNSDFCEKHNKKFTCVCICSPFTPMCVECIEDSEHEGDNESTHTPVDLNRHIPAIMREWVNINRSLRVEANKSRKDYEMRSSRQASIHAAYSEACDEVNRSVDALRHQLEIYRRERIRKLREIRDEEEVKDKKRQKVVDDQFKPVIDLLQFSEKSFAPPTMRLKLATFGELKRKWEQWKAKEEADDDARSCVLDGQRREMTLGGTGSASDGTTELDLMKTFSDTKSDRDALLSIQTAVARVTSGTFTDIKSSDTIVESSAVGTNTKACEDAELLMLFDKTRWNPGRSSTQALRLLESYRKEGSLMATALHELATYKTGDCDDTMIKMAAWLELQVESKPTNVYAVCALAEAYWTGAGVGRDPGNTIMLLEAVAQVGVAYAQAALGSVYFRGYYVAKDIPKAAAYFRRAALNGHQEAQFQLARILECGHRGVPSNYEEAMHFYKLSASQSNCQYKRNPKPGQNADVTSLEQALANAFGMTFRHCGPLRGSSTPARPQAGGTSHTLQCPHLTTATVPEPAPAAAGGGGGETATPASQAVPSSPYYVPSPIMAASSDRPSTEMPHLRRPVATGANMLRPPLPPQANHAAAVSNVNLARKSSFSPELEPSGQPPERSKQDNDDDDNSEDEPSFRPSEEFELYSPCTRL